MFESCVWESFGLSCTDWCIFFLVSVEWWSISVPGLDPTKLLICYLSSLIVWECSFETKSTWGQRVEAPDDSLPLNFFDLYSLNSEDYFEDLEELWIILLLLTVSSINGFWTCFSIILHY